MEIDCPKCFQANDPDSDQLPSRACDNVDYECTHCEHVFAIGWVAELELR